MLRLPITLICSLLMGFIINPFTARPEKNIIRSQCMGNSRYRRQHYITYHGYNYSLPSVAGFIRQSADYYLFPPLEISVGQDSERVNCYQAIDTHTHE